MSSNEEVSIKEATLIKVPLGRTDSINKNLKDKQRNLNKLYISVAICVIFMTGEVIGGLVSGSLAILTDAAHVLSDILGFCISIISMHISKLPSTRRMSYGFHRAEVIGALLSISFIWGLTIWLLSEAIHRMIHPTSVDGTVMLITATGGLIGNIIMGVVLGHTHSHHSHDSDSHNHSSHAVCHDHEHTHSENFPDGTVAEKHPNKPKSQAKNLNMRAAFLHVIGDALQSIGVIIAGMVIFFKPKYSLADPICTVIFSVIVMFTTVPIVVDCVKVLMEATPNHVNSVEVEKELLEIEEVIGLHDLHIWGLSAEKISMSCHITSNSPNEALIKATKLLSSVFGIKHTTLQIELPQETMEFECKNFIH